MIQELTYKIYKMETNLQNKNRLADIESKLVVTKGDMDRGR